MRPIFTLIIAIIVSNYAVAQAEKPELQKPANEAAAEQKLPPLPAAQKLLRDEKYSAAAEAFRALIKERATPLAYAGLVRSLLRMQDLEGARETIKKALSEFPNAPILHEANGEVLFRNGVPWEAEVELAKAINTGGPNAQAYLWLSRVYTTTAFHKKSRTMLERAYRADPDDPEVAAAHHRAITKSQPIAALIADGAKQDDATLEVLHEAIAHRESDCTVVGPPRNLEFTMIPLMWNGQYVHGFGLDMTFNGQRGRLLLDTGAGGILMSPKLAEKAGVKRIAASKIGGIGDKGPAAAYVGHIESVKLGDLELRDCLVEVTERKSDLYNEGLIGTDLFKDFMVRIDFPTGKFRLGPLPARPAPARLETKAADEKQAGEDSGLEDPYRGPELQNFTPMYRVGHQLLIPTRINDSVPKLFLLDTGAEGNFISPEAAREATGVYGDAWGAIKGLSGSVKYVYTASQATLQFSHYRQTNQDIVAFDLSRMSTSVGMKVSGAIGLSVLRMMDIYIDYRDGLIDFKINPRVPTIKR